VAEGKEQKLASRIAKLLLACFFVVLMVPIALLYLFAFYAYGVFLMIAIWICWCTRGVRVLLITSDSPVWRDHIETEIVPRLPTSTVRLNWSERRHWRSLSLAVQAFRCFGGETDFNPMVLVFRPFHWPETYRFRSAFQDHKHGKTERLDALQRDLFESLRRSGELRPE